MAQARAAAPDRPPESHTEPPEREASVDLDEIYVNELFDS